MEQQKNTSKYGEYLEKSGLSTEQSLIYQALLENGISPARKISLKSGVGRAMTYKTLDQLEELGLIKKYEKPGEVARFEPESPRNIEKILETQENQIKQAQAALGGILGSMISDFNLLSGKPSVQFFEGEKGVEKALFDTLNVPKNTEIYTYADLDAILRYIPELNLKYSEKRERLGIKKKGLILDSIKTRAIITDYHTSVTETKFIKYNEKELATVMQIYENKVSYITLKENSMIGVIIEDSSIYKMHKALFEYTWENTPFPS